MSPAMTPCPTWCTREHGPASHHFTKVGETDTFIVQLAQYPGAVQGFVQIIDCLADSKQSCLAVDTDELLAFARLMDRLGHPVLAVLVRQGYAFFAAGVAASEREAGR